MPSLNIPAEVEARVGELWLRRNGGLWTRLLPAGEDSFLVAGIDDVELRFERGLGGGVVAMRLRYADGDEERAERARL